MLNPYFKYYNTDQTQRMVEDLTLAAIKIYGFDVYYIPRIVEKINHSFGEDPNSSFQSAAKVEVYVVDGELSNDVLRIGPLGLEKRDTITLQIARRRFEEIRTPGLMMENANSLQNEEADTNIAGDGFGFELENNIEEAFLIRSDKPMIGDLIYMPIDQKLYEIKHVKDRVNFYQFGKLQLHELYCELFEYSHETIATDIAEIDQFNNFNGDALISNLETENDLGLTLEDGGNITLEEYTIEHSDKQANNTLFTLETEGVVDFSEKSPFIRMDEKRRY